MQFHYINTNEKYSQSEAYRKWLNLGYGFTNGKTKPKNFQPGDLVFMYVKEHGIKAMGMVIQEWDGVEYHEPIISSDTNNEFRVRINWFCVLPDGFVSPSEIKEILVWIFSYYQAYQEEGSCRETPAAFSTDARIGELKRFCRSGYPLGIESRKHMVC